MIDEIGQKGEGTRDGGLLGGEEDIGCNVVKSQILGSIITFFPYLLLHNFMFNSCKILKELWANICRHYQQYL